MFNGQITYCDAEKVVDDGSYKSMPDETLREMYKVCLNAGGSNHGAVDRIRRKGEIIREELSSREKKREEQQNSIAFSNSEDPGQPVSQQISNDDSNVWNETKLEELIRDKIEENYTLEYKSAAALSRESKPKFEITKDVSALANSAGGILIYGMAEFQDDARKHLPEKIDPINRNDFSKEWLENIIFQIQPRISDLKIYPVQLASNADHVIYVIEVPQGNTAHQATDCRYYRRFNFQSVPMQDNEVRDVLNRKSHPRVSINAKFSVYQRRNNDGAAGALIVEICNESNVFARHVAFVIHSPIRVRNKIVLYRDANLDNGDHGWAWRLVYSNHDKPPLFPKGKLKQVFQFDYGTMTPEPQKQLDHFRWVAFADSMLMQSGTFSVDEIYEIHPIVA